MTKRVNVPSSQQMLLALDAAIKKIEAYERQLSEPIAIIGLSCRFPGADNPSVPSEQRQSAFWDLLRDGVDAISKIPADRWDVEAFYSPNRSDKTKMYTREIGAIEKVAHFDASFFGISPREAERIDPQQRLLLEACWEALENAGQAPDKLRKTKSGVFMGLCSNDYALLNGASTVDYLLSLGTDNSMVAGRISHTLGLQGPALFVNTACSSSLVTIHLACQSLRNGESNLALAGGVNLILAPQSTISLCRHNALSPDGRCKTFDASADGYVRGEGCGVVVLKRLQDALANGDHILAVIRGSAVNHDGPSSSLTAPNEQAQEQLLRQALKNAKVQPDEVSYIEAHGTGTPLGDPIEIGALGAVFGKRTEPLWVGSAKTNIGHLEGAAGIAGVIKIVLMLQHGEIPPHLHFKTPNPYIDWENWPLKIPTECHPWRTARIASVSSFGFSGTNAHIVLAEAPLVASSIINDRRVNFGTEPIPRGHAVSNNASAERPWHLLTLSAKNEQALADLVQRYQTFLSTTNANLADICYTANTGRSHFAHRLALRATSRGDMQAHLAAYNEGSMRLGASQGYAPSYQSVPKVAFLFTGQGSQYVQMGRELYQTQPTFRECLERCAKILQPILSKPLLSILFPSHESNEIDQTAYTQPALFALEYALAQLWLSWGIEPDVVIGHSVGEYVAACVAGVFSLEDGLKLIAERGRLMQALPAGGAMVSLMTNYRLVQQAIAPYPNEISIAAINGPESVVISGKREAVLTVAEQLATEGIKTRKLTVSHAFHSPLMAPMLDQFRQVAASISYHKPKLPLVSNMTGKVVSTEISRPDYWVRHVRKAVRFADGVRTLAELSVNIFLEIGPKARLLGMARLANEEQSTAPEGTATCYLPSLRENQNDWQQMLTTLGELYVRGVSVDWEAFDQAYQRRKVVLPTYPFQRQRYWLEKQAYHDRRVQNESAYHPWKGQSFELSTASDSSRQTELIQHLQEGDVQSLCQLLSAQLSPAERTALPAILQRLVKEQKRQAALATIQDWLYTVEWQPQSLAHGAADSYEGKCIIFICCTGVGEALAERLRQRGVQPLLVTAGSAYQQVDDDHVQINPLCPEDYQHLLSNWPQVQQIVHLWSLDAPVCQSADDLANAIQQSNNTVLRLVQALAQRRSSLTSLCLVTQDTQAVQKTDSVSGVAHATLWGMGKVIALEHPELNCICIDLDETIDLATPAALAAEMFRVRPAQSSRSQPAVDNSQSPILGTPEDQIAFRHGVRYVARLVRYNPQAATQSARHASVARIQADATYLITGGLGGLGMLMARWLINEGARHLMLMGRSRPKPLVQGQIDQWEAQGITITIARADVSKSDDVSTALAQIVPQYPLRGIIHAAGVLDDGVLLNLNWERFHKVLRPKVWGAWHLHTLTQTLALDFFVLFASTSGLFGNRGQANYAAANAFLDALAHQRRNQGQTALSIDWDAWGEVGMAARKAQASPGGTTGEALIAPDQGTTIFAHLLGQAEAQIGVAPIDWAKFSQEAANLSPFFSAFATREAPAPINNTIHQIGKDRVEQVEWRTRLADAPAERPAQLRLYLNEQVAQILGHPRTQALAPHQSFSELGMDSLMSIDLQHRMTDDLGINVPLTDLIDTSIEKLANVLATEWGLREMGQASASTTQTPEIAMEEMTI